ncbi:MAG: hypothetical protein RLZZ185_867 [Bacteroidota bacterium]
MIRSIYAIVICYLLFSCGAAPAEAPTPMTPAVPEKAPDAVDLGKPLNNTSCLEALNSNQVEFSWTPVATATSYELKITNLKTNVTETKAASTSPALISLSVGETYAWSVVSKSTKTSLTATSPVWKFYFAGPGELNLAPNPAQLISPKSGEAVDPENGQFKLSWKATDNDTPSATLSYEVYFGEDFGKVSLLNVPALKTSNTSVGVPVQSGKVYYWQVKTMDGKSASYSAVYGFRVN